MHSAYQEMVTKCIESALFRRPQSLQLPDCIIPSPDNLRNLALFS